jgi:hypothetical protein
MRYPALSAVVEHIASADDELRRISLNKDFLPVLLEYQSLSIDRSRYVLSQSFHATREDGTITGSQNRGPRVARRWEDKSGAKIRKKSVYSVKYDKHCWCLISDETRCG